MEMLDTPTAIRATIQALSEVNEVLSKIHPDTRIETIFEMLWSLGNNSSLQHLENYRKN